MQIKANVVFVSKQRQHWLFLNLGDCNQHSLRPMKVAFVFNHSSQWHLKVTIDCNQHLVRIQKNALITVPCHFYV